MAMNNKNHHSAVSATLKKNIFVVMGVALLMSGQLQGDGGLQKWFGATPEDEEELTAQWGEAVEEGSVNKMRKILRKARTPEERLRIINSSDEMDETALISAVRQGRKGTVVAILDLITSDDDFTTEQKRDAIDFRDAHGWTAVELATHLYEDEIANIISMESFKL